jgi:phosphate/sulfate permease
MAFFVVSIFFLFRENGGSIQQVVVNKTGIKYVRSATLIDFVYAIILLFFKEWNSIPMSTTWVFIGLLSGREMAIALSTQYRDLKSVFPIVRQDFMKLVLGMGVSVVIAWAVNLLK